MKILVVDDSKAMRMIVMRTLRQIGLGQATFLEAGNGVLALEAIKAEHPDLVLADWNMPEMNGIDLLRNVKAQNLGVRLGFVTSETSEEIKSLAFGEGAAFLVSKPFTPDSLKAAIGDI